MIQLTIQLPQRNYHSLSRYWNYSVDGWEYTTHEYAVIENE